MTRDLLLLLLLLLFLPAVARGSGGEDCASATPILSLPYLDSGNTCAASDDYLESCPFPPTGGRDVVYRYTPAVDETIVIDLCDSDFDTKVHVYAGACPGDPGAGPSLGCNDDACGFNNWRSHLVLPLSAGVEVFIVVDGYGAADCGDYLIDISVLVPTPSDTCPGAETLSLPYLGTITTSGATDDYNEACPFTVTGAPDVVRRVVPAEDGLLVIELCDADFDTKVYVHEGTCPPAGALIGGDGSGVALACNDDACGVFGWRSQLLGVPVSAGVEYFLVFDGYGTGDSGDALVSVSQLPPPGPGESCETALPILGLPFSTSGATGGPSRFEHACQFVFTGAPEHYYTFTAPTDLWLEIDTCGSSFDTELTVLGGPCSPAVIPDPLVVRGCNDDGCGEAGTRARISALAMTAGETITIVLDGHVAGEEGEYQLVVRETCAPDHPSESAALIPVGARPVGLALHEGTGRLFVANLNASTLSVIDTATDTVEATLPTGAGPYRLAITPDQARLYVVCFSGDTIDCFDPWTLSPIASFPSLGPQPLGLSFSPDSSALFVSTEGDGRLTKWSIPGHQPLGSVSGLGAPREVITGPLGDAVFVTDTAGTRVWRVAADTLAADSITLDEFPQALALTPEGTHLLVGNFGFDRSLDHASVIDLHAWQVVARLRIGTGPEEMVTIPGTPYLAVSNWGFSHHPNQPGPSECGAALGNVTIVRLPDFTAVGDPIQPPMLDTIEAILPARGDYTFGIAVTPDGRKLYAANSGYACAAVANTIAVLDYPDGWISGRFVRGDANADGAVDLADPIAILGLLFAGGDLACAAAGDTNDDEQLDIADPIALLGLLFAGSTPPLPPECAADPTAGPLCCAVGCSP